MDRPFRIIAIDDEETMLRILKRSLEPEGYEVEVFTDAKGAVQRLTDGQTVDVVITDLMMPDMDGFKVVEKVLSIDKDIIVIVITAYSSVESAVKAIKAGAYDFIPKPFDPEQIQIVVKRAIETRMLKLENIGLKKQLERIPSYKEIIGKSNAMMNVFSMIDKVKDTDGTILLIGESGVGKELVAKAIHYSSKRVNNPFIPINCGALPDDLLESELFGYEKGAFTGAINKKMGLLEAANKGTLFLDEVSSISPMMQVKLLRFLQERSFIKLGGKEIINVDVRIIAATNEDLKEAVNRGAFRKDLYYRLNVIPIEIPPLRERRDDIPILIRYFIKKFSEKTGKKIDGISKDAEDILIKYKWEGNVRELENVIERAVIITDSNTIGIKDIPEAIINGTVQFTEQVFPYQSDLTLFDVERLHIINILKKTNGNKSKAARILGIDYSTLRRKLNSMDISIE